LTAELKHTGAWSSRAYPSIIWMWWHYPVACAV